MIVMIDFQLIETITQPTIICSKLSEIRSKLTIKTSERRH